MKTSDSAKTCHTLTSSVEASPARTSAQQAPCRGLKGHAAVCSMKLPASFTRLSPDMSCWRTSQRSLITGWQTYSERWPAAGIMLDGACYRLQTWAPRTCANDGSASHGWPTPRSCTAMQAAITPSRAADKNPNLEVIIARQQWPTPAATDFKGSSKPGQRRGQLTEATEPNSAGRLNPEWVEMLMGFPAGWTDIDGPRHPDHASTHMSLPAPDRDNGTISKD